ncbi:meso-butanediol dehydrogenase/(S,S)-butanediol dehydrogenase/diacetyl reductase [Bacillus sp. SLBN-46]|uniref:SDR family NAD(P)-dependent oxidoreductase n=1 Tax=Bacillus sp. SLBN-46 TaxID=3042283 RepID=UPI002857568A|nr:SDR family oxidoreductase [Bacillus sp. SLBN-46]MDR6122926.1 meso-butanediol dehydrogenase/(S,S)-butanediol dehydrogenase/diacetyl reductase [Bacillus sp. SLBN-46]
MRFSQSIAVVTGAGSGIGRASAIRLANEGAKVILVGRTRGKLEKTAEEINRTSKIPLAEIFTADCTDVEDVAELAEYVQLQYGDLHVLVNNAGGSRHSRILEITEQDWDYVQDVNLKSVFLVSKALGKIMIEGAQHEEQRSRAIVNVASLSGHQAGVEIPHYSAAKAGVINFTRSLALELAPFGIRVNSVSPGFVETPLTEKGLKNDRFVRAIQRNTALQRVGNPEEIASVIAFAASPEASYMTGADLLVDGGWLIK